MKVYLVFFNGYMDGYGSMINILGIYSSEEKAKEAIEDATKNYLQQSSIPLTI